MVRYLKLDDLRPNNWFLDRAKLNAIREIWKRGEQYLLPAVLVTLIDSEYGLIDGHCRAYVALENGIREIAAELVEPSEIEYRLEWLTIFHRQGPFVGVKHVQDLGKRIIDAKKLEERPVRISQRLKRDIVLLTK